MSSTRKTVISSFVIALLLAAIALITNSADAAPAKPERQPTPVPGAPSSLLSTKVNPDPAPPAQVNCFIGCGPYQNWSPAQAASISNIVDKTVKKCDATGGHCARMHIVVQFSDGALRSYTSITCYSASGDFACKQINGNTWLNYGSNGNDVEGSLIGCFNNCSNPSSSVTPWYQEPFFSQQYSGAASFLVNTGAAGGGNFTISGITPTFSM